MLNVVFSVVLLAKCTIQTNESHANHIFICTERVQRASSTNTTTCNQLSLLSFHMAVQFPQGIKVPVEIRTEPIILLHNTHIQDHRAGEGGRPTSLSAVSQQPPAGLSGCVPCPMAGCITEGSSWTQLGC